MSMINQMLRDLDLRQASEQERAGLPKNLRRLPPSTVPRTNNLRILAVGMLLGALIAGLAVLLYMRTQPSASAPPTPPAAAVPAPRPVVPAPVADAPPAPASRTATPAELAEMKLSSGLQSPPKAPPAVAPAKPSTETPPTAPAPVAVPALPTEPKPEAPREAPPPPPPAPAAPVAPKQASAAPATTPSAGGADAQIDKRNKGGHGRDLAEAEYRKGMQAVKRGDSAAALTALQRAVDMDPMLAKARQALLSVLVSGKQWEDARLAAQAGLALDAKQVGWAVILARLQFEQGDATTAIETMARHAAYAETDADYQGLFAYLLQKQQRSSEAAQRFQAALALRPNEGRWWFGLGLSLESAGRSGEAKDAYARAKQVGNLPADMVAVIEQKLK